LKRLMLMVGLVLGMAVVSQAAGKYGTCNQQLILGVSTEANFSSRPDNVHSDISTDGFLVAISSRAKDSPSVLTVFETETGKKMHEWEIPEETITGVSLSESGGHVIVSTLQKKLRIYSLRTGKLKWEKSYNWNLTDVFLLRKRNIR